MLFEGAGEPGSLNHLGIEVESTDDMQAAQRRLTASDFDTNTQDGVTCCYAVQDKVWVDGPDERGGRSTRSSPKRSILS